ncbi:MAG TPA: hypothetical protein VFR32_10735 [Gaiellaceae bacterium]|nr:hypothetical protein [Gaiellaceae bacterium]
MKYAALVVCVLVLAAAGCGGGGGTSAEEAWAEEVCASIAAWKTEVETITSEAADAVTEPGATRADVEQAVDEGLAATKTLVEELRAAVPPDTPQGDEAQAAVEAFLDDVSAANDEVETALAALPESAGLSEVVSELGRLALTLQTTIAQGLRLADELAALGGALKDGVENADSCQDLRADR